MLMRWLTGAAARTRLTEIDGLREGMVVQHKVTQEVAVIVVLFEEDGKRWATVSRGWYVEDEIDTTIAEIEPVKQPESSLPAPVLAEVG